MAKHSETSITFQWFIATIVLYCFFRLGMAVTGLSDSGWEREFLPWHGVEMWMVAAVLALLIVRKRVRRGRNALEESE